VWELPQDNRTAGCKIFNALQEDKFLNKKPYPVLVWRLYKVQPGFWIQMSHRDFLRFVREAVFRPCSFEYTAKLTQAVDERQSR
jgi:hypothetical protein